MKTATSSKLSIFLATLLLVFPRTQALCLASLFRKPVSRVASRGQQPIPAQLKTADFTLGFLGIAYLIFTLSLIIELRRNTKKLRALENEVKTLTQDLQLTLEEAHKELVSQKVHLEELLDEQNKMTILLTDKSRNLSLNKRNNLHENNSNKFKT